MLPNGASPFFHSLSGDFVDKAGVTRQKDLLLKGFLLVHQLKIRFRSFTGEIDGLGLGENREIFLFFPGFSAPQIFFLLITHLFPSLPSFPHTPHIHHGLHRFFFHRLGRRPQGVQGHGTCCHARASHPRVFPARKLPSENDTWMFFSDRWPRRDASGVCVAPRGGQRRMHRLATFP